MADAIYACLLFGWAGYFGFVIGYSVARDRFNVRSPIVAGLAETAAKIATHEKFSGAKFTVHSLIQIDGERFNITMERA